MAYISLFWSTLKSPVSTTGALPAISRIFRTTSLALSLHSLYLLLAKGAWAARVKLARSMALSPLTVNPPGVVTLSMAASG